MGNCCSNNKNKGLGNDEDQAMEELGQLLKLQAGAEDAELSKVQLGFRCRSIRSPAKEAHIPQIRGKQMGAGLHIPTFHTHSTFITAHEISKGKETYLGRTETKLRDNHPQFLKTLTVCYEFQQVQEIKFELFDDMAGHQQSQFLGQLGGRGRTVHAQEPELLGTCTVKLVDIINGSPFIAKFEKMIVSRNRTTGEEIEKVHHAAQLIITHEEVVKTEGPQYEVVMDVSCRQLEAKNFFGAGGSDPFLVISRIVEGQFQPVLKTEYQERVMSCDWKTIVIKLERLCKGDFNAWIMLEVWDYEASGRHQLIGYTRQTLATLLANLHQDLELINDNNRGKEVLTVHGHEPYVCSGLLHINAISIDRSHSFLEFVRAGFDINVMICVDFSASNGPLDVPDSLHYCPPDDTGERPDNEYVTALRTVVKVLGQYDKDQNFPFFGFGAAGSDAQVGKNGKVEPRNIFPVSGDMRHQSVRGEDELIQQYWECLKQITPAEPTNFTQVLSKAYRSVSTNKDSYLIVLIVTDGQCSDFQQTIDMIVEASTEPISILIIGVGDGPFEKMEQLSADDRPLKSSTKQIMQRDIVGFVPFREYRNSPEDLARETLKEIPRQFTSWAKKNKITPEDAKKDKVPEAVVNPDLTHAALLRNTNDVEDEAKSADESDVETKSWESYSDDETGRRYYYNHTTKQSTWEPPRNRARKSVASASPQAVLSPSPARQSVAIQPVSVSSPTRSEVRVVPVESPAAVAVDPYTRFSRLTPTTKPGSPGPAAPVRSSSPPSKVPYQRLGSPTTTARSPIKGFKQRMAADEGGFSQGLDRSARKASTGAQSPVDWQAHRARGLQVLSPTNRSSPRFQPVT